MKKQNADTHIPAEHDFNCDLQSLLRLAQEGSHEAYLCLRAKYRPLLESSVARFGTAEMTDQEREDMKEEAERVFLGAVTTYDTDQDAVDFGLYAKICLRNGLVSEWRHQQSLRRVSVVQIEDTELTGDDPQAAYLEDEGFRKLCREVREQLSDYENRVWWQYVTGVSVADIAAELGRDERSVHNAIYRIRKKLRRRLTPPEA